MNKVRTPQRLFHLQHSTLWCQYFGSTRYGMFQERIYEGPCKIRAYRYMESRKSQAESEMIMVVEFPFPIRASSSTYGPILKKIEVGPYDIIFHEDTDVAKDAVLSKRKALRDVLSGWGERAKGMEKLNG